MRGVTKTIRTKQAAPKLFDVAHKIVQRNATQADLVAARRHIGRHLTETIESQAAGPLAGVAKIPRHYRVLDVYIDDLKRLVMVLEKINEGVNTNDNNASEEDASG